MKNNFLVILSVWCNISLTRFISGVRVYFLCWVERIMYVMPIILCDSLISLSPGTKIVVMKNYKEVNKYYNKKQEA
jgi:hypothetical protein